MKQYFTLTILLIFLNLPSFGQQFGGNRAGSSIVGKITGNVIDASTGDPVEYATVVLQIADFEKDVDGAISDERGHFKLDEIKPGSYKLVVSFIGYETKTIEDIVLTKKKPDADLGNITLGVDQVLLSEVEVVEKAPLLESKPDRLIYNAEQDATNSGGDASDVLRKVPMLSVDLEGNVQLRGSSNIKVLLNGKPSSMFSDNLSEALKAIPSDQIKKVEVITSPSAKYDGEGTGGIINIVTRKKNLEGMYLAVNSSVGTRSNSAGLTFNAKKGRLGFTSSGHSYYSWPADATTSFLREDFNSGGTRVYAQNGSTESNRLGFFGRAGLEYDINAYNSLQSSFSIRGHNSKRDGFSNGILTDFDNTTLQDFFRTSDGKDLRSGFDWSTDYIKTFKKKEQELSIAFRLDGTVSNTDRDVIQQGIPIFSNVNEILDNEGDNLESTIQIDYAHPFSENFKLEVGSKVIIRNIDSDYKYNMFDENSNAYWEDPVRSNLFLYDQDVASGYVSFNINLPKDFSIVTGIRYESTKINGEFDKDINPFGNDYDNWLPNFNINKRFKDFSSVKFGYSSRISRPSLYYINPFSQTEDQFNITFGNPLLRPETSDQYEIGYNAFKNGRVLSTSIFYRRTEGLIQQFTSVTNGGISNNTYENLGVDNAWGFNVFGSVTIKKIWTLRGNLNFNAFEIKSTLPGIDLSNDGIRLNMFFQSSLDLKKDWKVEMFGFWRSPNQTLQGETPSFWMYSFGVRKELWDKKASIGLRALDPFNATKKFETKLEGSNFKQNSSYDLPFRSIGISFSYKVGKLQLQQKNRGVKNDDQKQGDGDQQGGMQQQQK